MQNEQQPMIVLSHYQAEAVITARDKGQALVSVSLDLGMTTAEVRILREHALFPCGRSVDWLQMEEIRSSDGMCFRIDGQGIHAIRGFSEEFKRAYHLMPTEAAPAMIISGVLMHRIKGIDPLKGAHAMVHAFGPIRGRLLDTATGLGYAAIEAAKNADSVTTVELDPVAQEMARGNPWSQGLFDNPKITQMIGDSSVLIGGFPPGSFSCILHDPPVITMAGELYSGAFYHEALRILQPKGRMFHYIGDPESQSGSRTTKAVIRRLQEAGFDKIKPKPEAFGVMAYK